jgi:hypothetical protein
MSYSLVFSAKPHSKRTITVYEPTPEAVSSYRTIRACCKLIDAIFAVKTKQRPFKRIHMKEGRYMYITSDEYQLVRVKNFQR